MEEIFLSPGTKNLRPDVVTWTSRLGGYSKKKQYKRCIEIFEEMIDSGCYPDGGTTRVLYIDSVGPGNFVSTYPFTRNSVGAWAVSPGSLPNKVWPSLVETKPGQTRSICGQKVVVLISSINK
ncbi:hypothetical protein RD792_017980 [Penstemon davidsonii]|uniref:Pentatricopeptide repeat-containing protein n=1 Tax=Penstemon davidsonii TaxID=160366 RepID=A0ABR0DWE9_9LAMI|nr:hypothetical protein RD792_017980 [Penstemon davidsonii]